QVQFIMTLIFFGITSGAAVLTAQYWGKGNTGAIERIMGIAMRISLCVSVVFTLAGVCVPELCMRIFTSEPDVAAEGAKYLRVLSFTFPVMAVTIIYLNIMRSVERVVISTVVYSVSLVLNILLNAVLIFGLLGCPALGIVGAAVATLCARIAELVIVLIYARRKDHQVHLRFRNLFVKDPVLFKDFLHYALPVILNELMWGAGFSMNSVIIGHLGSPAVAANSVAQVTRNLATVVAFGIANATAILVGRTIGEGDVKRAEVYAKRFVRLTLCAGAAAAAVVLLVLPIMHKVMTLSEQAHSYLTVMMLVMSYFVFLQAYNTTMVVGIFRAGGDTRLGLIIDVSTMWGGSILFGALCAFVLKLPVEAVYVVLMSDEVIKVPITTLRYRQKKWLKNVTREL
ncbi:MATE family efflux transporter, partial [Ruminococcus champanellensis]